MRVKWDYVSRPDNEDGDTLLQDDHAYFAYEGHERHPRFSLAHRLKLIPGTDFFKLFHADVGTQGRSLLHTEHKMKFWENKRSGKKELNFTDIFNDQNFDFFWEDSGELSLAHGKMLKPQFGNYWTVAFNNGNPTLRSNEEEFKLKPNTPVSLFLDGKIVELSFDEEKLKVSMMRRNYPDFLDCSLTIPRLQATGEYIDLNGNVQTRFAFMDGLIPLPLRKDPTMPTGPIDQIWMRANLRETLGIKVQKNNPDPTSLE